jgi:hypothetical protein
MILPRLLALIVAFMTGLAVDFACMFVIPGTVPVLVGGVAAWLTYWLLMRSFKRRW